MIKYQLSDDNVIWTDITGLVNSKNTSITQNLCSTEFKSAVDTANVSLVPAANLELWSDTLSLLIDNDVVYTSILFGETVLFYGVVDKSNLEIETKRIPSSCNLTFSDISTIYLDKNPIKYSAYRNKKISEIIIGILTELDFPYTDIALDSEDDATLPAFIIDPEDSDDYRTLIDDLLFESGGYVLDTTTAGKATVVKLNWNPASSDTRRIIQEQTLSSVGVHTETAILDEDGIDLTYYSLAYSEADQAVHVGISSLSKTDEGLKGEDVANGYYYPEDGDLEATYEEYDDSLLDRAYNTKVNRKANEDLAIVDVTDTYLSLRAYGYNSDGTLDYNNLLDNDTAFEFPILTSLGMVSNPLYFSTKAWILLKNVSGKKVSINEFTIRGKALYKNRKNRVLLPSTTENPEEYEAKYIYTKERAEKFANFYWHFKKYSRFVSNWKENSYGTLGELVTVNHKATKFGQSALVVSKTVTFIREDFPQVSLTAVGVNEWNEYPLKTWGSNGKNYRGISGISSLYIAEDTGVEPGSDDERWSTSTPTITAELRYLWKKELISYQDGREEENVYLASVYGSKGEDGAFYQFQIESTNGVYFKSSSAVTILICRIYKNGAEEDHNGETYSYVWRKVKATGLDDDTFVPESPTDEQLEELGITKGGYKAIVVRANSIDELATYYCVVEEK